jgi:hypothetical protein
MRSLLHGVGPGDIRLDPFPHIVVDDPMEAALYAELSASYPPFSRIAFDTPWRPVPDNKRYEFSARAILDAPDLPDCWKEFTLRHSGAEFLAEVAALFRGHWLQTMLAAIGGGFEGRRTTLQDLVETDPFLIRQDARMEINTPVKSRPSSVRGPHLDKPYRLFSCLFYLRAPEDDSVGGDLQFWRWRDGVPQAPIDRFELPAEEVEPDIVIPYRANRLVIFPQTLHSLHGVTPREPTPHMRRYVFITAEIAGKWLLDQLRLDVAVSGPSELDKV